MKRGPFVFGLTMALVAFSPSRAQEPAIPVPDTIRVRGRAADPGLGAVGH